ncbi:hypothetical protein ElyMa_006092200, partial [Elysia marginata]
MLDLASTEFHTGQVISSHQAVCCFAPPESGKTRSQAETMNEIFGEFPEFYCVLRAP